MSDQTLSRIGLQVADFKCFGTEPQGFNSILPVNLIIGRNNSGKSTLLDVLESILSPRPAESTPDNVARASFNLTSTLIKEDIQRIYNGWRIPDNVGNMMNLLPRLFDKVGYELKWNVRTYTTDNINVAHDPLTDRFRLSGVVPFHDSDQVNQQLGIGMFSLIQPFAQSRFRRLSPDRDIRPEIDSEPLRISPNGEGLTTAIMAFLNKSHLSIELVEDILLREVNRVFDQDGVFTGIRAQLHQNDQWELFLEERNKGRIPLSRSGSGL